MTPDEIRAGEEARRAMVEHMGERPVLTLEQLAEMVDVRPRFEKEMTLPGDARGARNKIWFFSIDGVLRGNRFAGCLFAGECIMVQAESFTAALKLARDGLADSVVMAKQYLEELTRSIVTVGPIDPGTINIDLGGRRAGANVAGRDLASDPKMKALLEHVIGGKPWRW